MLWVARDKEGRLKAFATRPYRINGKLCVNTKNGEPMFGFNSETDFIYLESELFPYLKWEDEPIEVELVVKTIEDKT